MERYYVPRNSMAGTPFLSIDILNLRPAKKITSFRYNSSKVCHAARSETKLFPNAFEAEIEFVKNDQGTRTHCR
jgi:hypothetical protein